jgi:8-oxo-dGTP diphosphatase
LEIAARKLVAKIGLKDIYIEQLKTYGSAGAFRTACRITVAYFALVPLERLSGQLPPGVGGTAAAAWIPLKDYPAALAARGMSLAADQDRILKDLMARIQGKISYTPIAFELVPVRFTWPELRRVYEIVLGKRLDAANFKRKIRSMYRIRELKVRGRAATVGRPPKRLRFEGVKELYV